MKKDTKKYIKKNSSRCFRSYVAVDIYNTIHYDGLHIATDNLVNKALCLLHVLVPA